MPVRPATPEDLPAIGRLIRQLADYEDLAHEVVWTPADLEEHLFGPRPAAEVLVAEGDGRVVGMAVWLRTFSTFLGRPGIWLEDLFVEVDHRGRGHGRALLEALMARTPGRLEWAVLDWNAPSIAFYEGLGARPVEGWTRYRWLPSAASDGQG